MSGPGIARLLGLVLGAALGLALGVLLLGDLGGGTLWNTDDALYGLVVRRMIAAHTWRAAPWFDYDIAQAYPLGVRWMALVAALAGTGPFGLRLSSVIAGLAAAGALLALGRDRRGLAAAGLWLVQPLVHLFSQRVMHDALLAATTAAAIALYHHAEARPRRIVGAGLACGLASLVKAWAGGVALAVIALDVLLWRRHWLRRGRAWLALGLALGVPVAWLGAAGQLGAMIRSMSERLLVGLPGHGGAAVAAAGAGVAPAAGPLSTIVGQGAAGWLLLALAAVGLALAARRRDALDRLLVCWLVVTLAITLATRTFLPQYALLPVLPLCALGGGALAWLAGRAGEAALAAIALPLLLLCAPLVAVGQLARHADDRTAALALEQRRAPKDALLCTVDAYHASPTFYAERPVLYLTEDPPSRSILRRVFGEQTVPTLQPGELAARLDGAPSVACLASRARAQALLPTLRAGYELSAPPEDLSGDDVVLIRR